MSYDPIESICVIPSDGFDEIWMVVNRENGRFVERLVERIERYNCVTGVRSYLPDFAFVVDSGLSYGEDVINISSINLSDPIVITATAHGFSDGEIVRIDNIPEFSALDGTSWTINSATANTFELETQVVE